MTDDNFFISCALLETVHVKASTWEREDSKNAATATFLVPNDRVDGVLTCDCLSRETFYLDCRSD